MVLKGGGGRFGLERLGLRRLARDGVAVVLGLAGLTAAAATTGGAILVLLGVTFVARLLFEERLPVGDRDLVVVGMDFAEGEETVPVAAVIDEGGLQGRFDPRNLGEIDIAAELPPSGGLEVEFLDFVAADHDDPRLLRVGGIDKHFVGHDELST
jgi:hypothetical protein